MKKSKSSGSSNLHKILKAILDILKIATILKDLFF